jgi:PIN domain nuclease of toxin-antitoxin system
VGGRLTLIVIDTHVVLRMDLQPRRLGRKAGRELRRELTMGSVSVSAISFWEVGLLVQRGRVRLGTTVSEWRRELLAEGMRELPVTGEVAIVASGIGGIPDPADRLIMATAIQHGAFLATADETILAWEGDLNRLDVSR